MDFYSENSSSSEGNSHDSTKQDLDDNKFSMVAVNGDNNNTEGEHHEPRQQESDDSSTPKAPEINIQEHQELLPVGVVFSPRSFDLIVHFLLRKIFGLPFPANRIQEIDLYQFDPPQLPIGEFTLWRLNEAYFFTDTDQIKHAMGSQPRRSTKGGFWKEIGRDKKIYYKNKVIGYKKFLIFYWETASPLDKTRWVMHEFRVNPNLFRAAKVVDVIRSKGIDLLQRESCGICKIIQKKDTDKVKKNVRWKKSKKPQ